MFDSCLISMLSLHLQWIVFIFWQQYGKASCDVPLWLYALQGKIHWTWWCVLTFLIGIWIIVCLIQQVWHACNCHEVHPLCIYIVLFCAYNLGLGTGGVLELCARIPFFLVQTLGLQSSLLWAFTSGLGSWELCTESVYSTQGVRFIKNYSFGNPWRWRRIPQEKVIYSDNVWRCCCDSVLALGQ